MQTERICHYLLYHQKSLCFRVCFLFSCLFYHPPLLFTTSFFPSVTLDVLPCTLSLFFSQRFTPSALQGKCLIVFFLVCFLFLSFFTMSFPVRSNLYSNGVYYCDWRVWVHDCQDASFFFNAQAVLAAFHFFTWVGGLCLLCHKVNSLSLLLALSLSNSCSFSVQIDQHNYYFFVNEPVFAKIKKKRAWNHPSVIYFPSVISSLRGFLPSHILQ